MTTYGHGGDVNSFAAHCGFEVSEIVDLSSNINFITPTVDFSSVNHNANPS